MCHATTLAAPAHSANVARINAAGRSSQTSEIWKNNNAVAVPAPSENATEIAPSARIHPATPPTIESSGEAEVGACALACDGTRDAASRFASSPASGRSITMEFYHNRCARVSVPCGL